MTAMGLIMGTEHEAACECEDLPRRVALTHHKWPKVLLADMLQRDFSKHGRSYDMMTETTVPLPTGSDLYVCGFPCQPWSLTNSNSTKWKHKGAQIIFAMKETLKEVKPRAAILENVKGLIARGAWAEMSTLLDNMGLYYIALITDDDIAPKHLGHPVNRPRVYIVLLLIEEAPVFIESNDDLQKIVVAHLKQFRDWCKQKAGRLSFTRFLSKHGPASSAKVVVGAASSSSQEVEPISNSRKGWMQQHKKVWETVKARQDYFKEFPGTKSFLTTQRERDLADLIWNTSDNQQCQDLALALESALVDWPLSRQYLHEYYNIRRHIQ